MASNVSNAIGQVANFMPRPDKKETQKYNSLKADVSNTSYYSANAIARDADDLARALTGLSSQVDKYDDVMRKANYLADTKEATKFLEGKTADDIAKLDATGYITDKGINLSDSPYAMAIISQDVGKSIASEAHNEWVANEKHKTANMSPAETAQAYNNFVKSYVDKRNVNNTINKDLLNKGIESVRSNREAEVAYGRSVEIDHENKTQAVAGARASAFNLATTVDIKDKKKLVSSTQDFIHTMYPTLTTSQRVAVIDEYLPELIDKGLTAEDVRGLANELQVGIDDKGNAVTYGAKTSALDKVIDYANKRETNERSTRVYKHLKEIEKLSIDETLKYFDNLQETDMDSYDRLVPFKAGLLNDKETRIAKEKEEALKNRYAIDLSRKATTDLSDMYTKYALKGTTFVNGVNIPTNDTDASRVFDPTGKWKLSEQDKGYIYAQVMRNIYTTYSDEEGNITNPKAMNDAMMRVNSNGTFKDFAKNEGDTIALEVSSAVSGVEGGSDPNISPKMNVHLKQYNINPEAYRMAYGEGAYRMMNKWSKYSKVWGEDPVKGLRTYAQVRTNEQDEVYQDKIKKEIYKTDVSGISIDTSYIPSGMTYGYNGASSTKLSSVNNDFEGVYNDTYSMYRNMGKTVDEATSLTKGHIATNYMNVDGSLMPRSFIDAEIKSTLTYPDVALGTTVGNLKYAYAEKFGVSPSSIEFDYDIGNGNFYFKSPNGCQILTKDEFRNEVLYHGKSSEEMTIDDAKKVIRNRNADYTNFGEFGMLRP